MLKWIRWLNPANLILLKRLLDAIEVAVRLIEEIWPNPGDDKKRSD